MASHHEAEPELKAPPLACDSHFHVFGPADRYPYGTDLRYKPPLAPLADFLALSLSEGIVPPIVGLAEPLAPLPFVIGSPVHRTVRRGVLSGISFGGTYACLVFEGNSQRPGDF